uniref:Uncharacterized protein n=1 Tax=Panagrolaimus superbus TaxID=310955 RepID=A0A914YS18_9BILA
MPPENDSGQIEVGDYKGLQYSPEELKLLITSSIHKGSTSEALIKHLGNIGDGPTKFVKVKFDEELLKICKAKLKDIMAELVSAGNTKFIFEARKEIKLDSTFFTHIIRSLDRNGIHLEDEKLAYWPEDLQKFYYFLESRFIPTGPEETLKNLIVEWFEAGEMSLEIWKQWVSWFSNGISLKTLKSIKWSKASQKDTVRPKFLKTLATIPTDDFLEKEVLRKILTLYLEEPKVEMDIDEYVDENGYKNKVETKAINVIGRTIFLSTIKSKLESLIKEKNIEEIDIISKNTFHIDDSLEGHLWNGKNISIVADKVNVWDEQIFDVSGQGYSSTPGRKARDGGTGENGFNGRDGKSGLSSGNIAIITEDMTNSDNLTVKLIGGDGEDAESGGNGGDGKDGIGVTLDELKDIAIKYVSLWDTIWSKWTSYHPTGWTKTWEASNFISSYIWYEFEDVHGRKLHYTFGADKGFLYNWYELVIWIKGTDGTPGGIGGLNGKGGEGGNPGECTIINPTTGWEYSINKVRRNGRNGMDGKVGECGKSGYNGNHMALIDRSAKGSNLHYYGDAKPCRLTQSWSCDNTKYSRINRYYYIVKDDASCYGSFQNGDIPTSGLRQQQQQKKEERSSEAQTTMKKSIVLNKVMQKAQEQKAKMDSAMSAAAASIKSKITQKLNLEEEVEEEESTEQEQEVVIVKEVNEDQLDISRTKARKCKLSPLQFVNKIKQKRSFEGACLLAQEIVDYFLIEFNDDHLESIKFSILKKCGRFREIMENRFQRMIVSAVQAKSPDGLTYFELQTLAKNASSKRILKKNVTKFRQTVLQFPLTCQTAALSIEEKLIKNGNILEKVKFCIPESDKLWFHDISRDAIEDIVKLFFKDYRFNKVSQEMLLKIFHAHSNFATKYSTLFQCFENSSVKWADSESWEGFKPTLTEGNANIKKIITTIAADKE